MSLEQYELEMHEWKCKNDDMMREKLSIFKNSVVSSLISESPANGLEYLLVHMAEYQDLLLSCFSDPSIVDQAFISQLIHVLCKYDIDYLPELFEQFSQVKYIFHREHGYDIVTPRGKFVFYKASEALPKYSKVLRQCHTLNIQDSNLLVSLFASEFQNAHAITCLMRQLCTGLSYESFVRLEEENGVLDLCHNTFYEGDHFERLYQPKVLVKKKTENMRNPLLEEAFKNQG